MGKQDGNDPEQMVKLHALEQALDEWIAFLDADHPGGALRKHPDLFHRHRVEAYVQVVGNETEPALVLVVVVAAESRGDDGERPGLAFRYAGFRVGEQERVVAAVDCKFPYLDRRLQVIRVFSPAVRREHHEVVFAGKFAQRVAVYRRSGPDHRARMAEPRYKLEQHRHVEALGQLEGEAGHLVGFLLVVRLKAGNLGEIGEIPAVLLVLRAVHAGVVAHRDHEAALYVHQHRVHEGVGRDVQADVLHRHDGAAVDRRGPHGRFVRRLLVGTPQRLGPWLGGSREGTFRVLRYHALHVFDYFGRRGARVPVREAGARVQGSQADCFVTEQYVFRHLWLPPMDVYSDTIIFVTSQRSTNLIWRNTERAV